jgi:hypothetical protein
LQAVQTNRACDTRLRASTASHVPHVWLLDAAGTSISRPPRSASLSLSKVLKMPHP